MDKKLRPGKNDKKAKADYVRRQTQDRDHHCHAVGCGKKCKPAYFMCYGHWMALPPNLRAKIWEHYRPGQEKDGRPTMEYLYWSNVCQVWLAEKEDLPEKDYKFEKRFVAKYKSRFEPE